MSQLKDVHHQKIIMVFKLIEIDLTEDDVIHRLIWRFNGFDVEMAKVTAKAFKNSSNEEKSMFSGYFRAMWNGNIDSEDMNFSESIEGFRVLLHELEEQKKHLEIQKKSICKTSYRKVYWTCKGFNR